MVPPPEPGRVRRDLGEPADRPRPGIGRGRCPQLTLHPSALSQDSFHPVFWVILGVHFIFASPMHRAPWTSAWTPLPSDIPPLQPLWLPGGACLHVYPLAFAWWAPAPFWGRAGHVCESDFGEGTVPWFPGGRGEADCVLSRVVQSPADEEKVHAPHCSTTREACPSDLVRSTCIQPQTCI